MKCICALSVLLVSISSGTGSSQAQVPIRTIAYTGQQAPGTNAVFNSFFSPTISSLGGVAGTGSVLFTGGLFGSGVNETNGLGIWMYEEYYNSLGLVARKGDQAPGFPSGTTFGQLGFEYPVIGPHHNMVSGSRAVFFAILSGGLDRRSVWNGTRGISPNVVAYNGGFQSPHTVGPIYTPVRFNDSAPAISSITFSSAAYSTVYSTDTTALWAAEQAPDTAGHITSRIVTRNREQIPGLVPGFQFGHPLTHMICDNGYVVFSSGIVVAGSGTPWGNGIWRKSFTSQIEPVLVALNGAPVVLPGLNAGESIGLFEYVLANAPASVAFSALISGSPGGYGIWAQDTGYWRLAFRSGMQVPGLPQGITFQSLREFSNTPGCIFFSDADELIFMARIQGSSITTANDMTVWRLARSGFRMVAREGDQIAGVAQGVVFDRIWRIAANRFGEMIIEAQIRGSGITTANNYGIWALNNSGNYVPVVQKGNQVEVESGVMRTLNQVSLAVGDPDYYSTGTDGRSTVFNRLRQVVFHASFLDNAVGVNAVCMANLQSVFTDVQEGSGRPPSGFSLHQNYPNPFNPVTNIRFQIADFGFVSLKVFDVLGREVATPVNEVKAPGEYSVSFDGSHLASGVYFYRLTAGEYNETKKLLLMK